MNGLQRQRLLLIAAGLCIAALAGDHFIVEPLIETWKTRSQRIVELKQSLEKGESLLDREATLYEREREMRGLSLPADHAAAENRLLTALGDWAGTSNLAVTALRPRWIEDDEQGRRLEIRLSATGDINKIGRFLHAMESDAIPLRVEEVQIRARDDKGKELNLETQLSSIVLAEAKP